ncbi:glycosyltransferase family 2 protein [Niallia circulans]|uniref:glycosyltransferase family 2 protein n=1 Tax=Niallia circulans TaxID=1397 RepID=UPI003D991F68
MNSEGKEKKISIVIPTFNRSDLLVKAIKSVQAQGYENIEIVVVDDCSTDDTRKVVEKLNDKRIKYIKHKENMGGAVARNTGIQNSSGEYIAFLDSDDTWLSNKLKKQIEVFSENPEVGLVYTGFQLRDMDNNLIKDKVPKCKGWLLPSLLKSNCVGTTSTIMVKRSAIQNVNGFDPNLPSCQDWDLYIRLSQHIKFDYVEESLVVFFQHKGNRITTNNKSALNGYITIYKNYVDLAIRENVYHEFSLNISKIILSLGIKMENKDNIKFSRNIIKQEIKINGFSIASLYVLCMTYINVKLLFLAYNWLK